VIDVSTTRSSVNRDLPVRDVERYHDVDIANLSTHGCAVKAAEPQEVGTRCWIILPTLESWSARVSWSDGALFGLDFSRPLHRAVAEMIVVRTNGNLPWPTSA